MAKKRKEGIFDDHDPSYRDEIMKLTQMVKSWEFTCSFCFKKFASAQAMGGHQNAHRNERLEEKRLFVRDPIGYRKRAYLRAMKAMNPESSNIIEPQPNPTLNLHAATKMVKHELSNYVNKPKHVYSSANNNGFGFGSGSGDNENINYDDVMMCKKNLPKELSLAENVGINHADAADEEAKQKPCIDFNIDGYGINIEKLDLTLKL